MAEFEVVRRPQGGRPYRATRPPSADVLHGFEDGLPDAVIVWRTHDVDVATALAARAWREHEWADGGPLPGVVDVGWWKKVPCRPVGDHAWIAWPQEAGWGTPGVRFSEEREQ